MFGPTFYVLYLSLIISFSVTSDETKEYRVTPTFAYTFDTVKAIDFGGTLALHYVPILSVISRLTPATVYLFRVVAVIPDEP